MNAAAPLISVVIATRERPHDVQRALNALMRCLHAGFEILVAVDPEESGTTVEHLGLMLRAARGAWRSQPAAEGETVYQSEAGIPVRYVRSPQRGTSAARNEGARRARGALVAFTDDDCTVPTDWLRRIHAAFAASNPPDLVSGAMQAAPHDPTQVHIPEFRPPAPVRLRRRWVRPWILGVGANMAMPRSTFARLGGFDARLGPGTAQRGEDTHLAYRVLQAGLQIQLDPSNAVVHWGARPVEGGYSTRLLHANWFGVGACYGLLLAEGDPIAALVFGRELRSVAAGMVLSVTRGSPGLGTDVLATAVRGFVRGIRLGRRARQGTSKVVGT